MRAILFVMFIGLGILAADAADQAPATQPAQASREHRDALIAKARARAREDAKKYTPAQLKVCEELYQKANKDWRSAEAVASLEAMLKSFPDVNRTGCATLYLAQMSKGKERLERLQAAMEKFSDCWYLNGAQVGALARFYRGIDLWHAGNKDDARKMFDEVKRNYPGAISHKGILLSDLIAQLDPGTAPATQPAGQ